MIGRKDCNGPQGSGINKDVSFSLTGADKHAVYAVTTGSYTQVEQARMRPATSYLFIRKRLSPVFRPLAATTSSCV